MITDRDKDLAQSIIDLGRVSLSFGRVDRITLHPDGVTPESDTDHTVMLGLIAVGLAKDWMPGLNAGLVAQYALVHDLVEVYAGDTPTLAIDEAGQEKKKEREQLGLLRLNREFGRDFPRLVSLIFDYEELLTPEARFVKALDKCLPKITHILNGAATFAEQGIGREQARERYLRQVFEIKEYAGDFHLLFTIHRLLVQEVVNLIGEGE